MILEIVTPEKVAYSEKVDQVTITTSQGEITVLPNHIPIVTTLRSGELIAKKGDHSFPLATGEGFVEVVADKVSVLTDLAISPTEIDEKSVEEAKKRAQQALEDRERLSEEEFAYTAAALEKALAQLKVKRKHRH